MIQREQLRIEILNLIIQIVNSSRKSCLPAIGDRLSLLNLICLKSNMPLVSISRSISNQLIGI